MKNILRFLKHSNLGIFFIILLLIGQAYCDLKLPDYTSDLLNIGLQQGGIEEVIPRTIRSEALDNLMLFLPDTDCEFIESAYSQADAGGIRSLIDGTDYSTVEAVLKKPECILFQLENNSESVFSISMLRQALSSGMMTKVQLLEQISHSAGNMENINDSILDQIAINYVSSEYRAQGTDMDAIRSRYLLSIGAKMLLMTLGMTAISILTGFLASKISAGVGRTLRQSIYEKVMAFTSEEMEHFSTASLITRSTNDIQQVQIVIVLLLRMVAYAPILAAGGVIMVIKTGAGMSWIIVLAVLILAACFGILIAIAMPKFRQMQALVDRLNLVSRELLTGIMPIRAFSREKHEEARFDCENHALYETQLFTNHTMTFLSPVMMLVMNGVSVLIVWVGAHRIDAGVIQIGDLTAFITYSMVIVMGFLMLGMICIVLPRAGVAADRIAEVMDMPLFLPDSKQPKDEQLNNPVGILCFQNVSFCYPGAEAPAISNITFTAKPGQTTAIIGSTGCGKTTLLNLIPRFYDVSSGSITVDGIDIRDISQKKLRSLLGYVPQKGVLFSGTIESNLKYGGDTVSDSDMYLAAEISQAADFITEKPERYQTAVAQGGSNVSGGQKQRLSIARAVAMHPKIYLFDDCFSALDYKTDLAVRKALSEQTGDSTVILVAQRISTILHANQIIVLDGGTIAGIGTHEELLKSCETYLEIAKGQLSEEELAFAMKGGNA